MILEVPITVNIMDVILLLAIIIIYVAIVDRFDKLERHIDELRDHMKRQQ